MLPNSNYLTLKTYIMKAITRAISFIVLISVVLPGAMNLRAQEGSSSGPSFDVGGDLVSSYVWRGSKFGNGPAIQPYVEFTAGNFSMGSWGSFCFTDAEAAEADLYIAYGFDFGLSLGLTDYYFPGTSYFDYSDSTGSHGYEINIGFERAGFSVSANYMLNEAGSAGTAGGDMYYEVGYDFGGVALFAGAGDGWHTADGEFAVCNLGLSTGKTLAISETFELPVTGSVILNPATEQFYIVLGLSL